MLTKRMPHFEKDLIEALLAMGALDTDTISRFCAQNCIPPGDVFLLDRLVEHRIITETVVARAMARTMNIPFIDISNESLSHSAMETAPDAFARFFRCMPYRLTRHGVLHVAICDMKSSQTLSQIAEYLYGDEVKSVVFEMTNPTQLDLKINKHYSIGNEKSRRHVIVVARDSDQQVLLL